MLTFFSFVVAGFGEELWRVATMRGLVEIAPRTMAPFAKNAVAVVVSALIFGIGHLYQGVFGVVLTAFIGIALGATYVASSLDLARRYRARILRCVVSF